MCISCLLTNIFVSNVVDKMKTALALCHSHMRMSSCHMAFRAAPLIKTISMVTPRWIKADRFPHTAFISTFQAFKQLTDCTVTSNCSHLSIHQTRPSACMIQIHTLITHTGVKQHWGTGGKNSHPLCKNYFLNSFSFGAQGFNFPPLFFFFKQLRKWSPLGLISQHCGLF